MPDLVVESGQLIAALRGEVSVGTVPCTVPESLVLEAETTPLFENKNLVVNTSNEVIVGLMRGNFQDYRPAFISIGVGGDFNQTTKLDTGSRVAPEITDTSLRQVLARIPILLTTDGNDDKEWSYVAVARPLEAITPAFNELGVETTNGTLISHYITDANADGHATTYTKTSLEYLIIRWKFRLELLTNDSFIPTVAEEGPFLTTQTSEGLSGAIAAEEIVGASTAIAIPAEDDIGTSGSVDVQDDDTITSEESDGDDADIFLTDQP